MLVDIKYTWSWLFFKSSAESKEEPKLRPHGLYGYLHSSIPVVWGWVYLCCWSCPYILGYLQQSDPYQLNAKSSLPGWHR